MATRVHEMRLVLQSIDPPGSLVAVVAVLDAWSAGWLAAPLPPEADGLWLITGHVPERIGTPEYARRAHTLVQEILDVGPISRAEADIPVRAYAGAAGIGAGCGEAADSPPGSEVLRWARDAIRCEEAWALPPGPGGATQGAGIVLGQPDTGYTPHPNLGLDALDLTKDRDVIDNDDDALDPLVAPALSPWPLPNPGHGTTTASVIAGRGDEETGIVGVAPQAKIVPVRAVESVVQFFDTDVARSVEYARNVGCDVISLSLGGKGFFGLSAAIQSAVDAGMIVLAAAGNNVGVVVAPASYPNCLAVAATGPHDLPWPESSRGSEVDLSAPGWGVHVAGVCWTDNQPRFEVFRASGTSYAVTHVAGVAALWLAHHGAQSLRRRYGGQLQAVFLHLLRHGGCRVPAGWDAASWGAGVVDAAAMLSLPLPDVAAVGPAVVGTGLSPLARLSALVSVDEVELEDALTRRLGVTGDDLTRTLARFEGELAFHIAGEPEFRASLLGGPDRDAAGDDAGSRATSSPQFEEMFFRSMD